MTRTRTRRRVAGVILAASAAGALGFAACGFPDVDFADLATAEEAGLEGAAGNAGDAGAASDDQAINPDVDPEGGAKDASTAGDAAQIDASGCTTCDCDNDGYNRLDLAKGCDGGPAGKRPDCDDKNAAIHPGLGFILDPWPPTSPHRPEGDWDCDGETIKQLPYDGACTSLSPCATGFEGNPPCGGTGVYLTCNKQVLPLGLTCSEKSREAPGERTQSCH